MKKIIVIILLIITGASFTEADAATKRNSFIEKTQSSFKVPRYLVSILSNGEIWMLTIYDDGTTTYNKIGVMVYPS
jgi:uncharacterized protein YxeA